MNKGWGSPPPPFLFYIPSFQFSPFFSFSRPLCPPRDQITKMTRDVFFQQTLEQEEGGPYTCVYHCPSSRIILFWASLARVLPFSFRYCPTRNRSNPGKSCSSKGLGPRPSVWLLFLEKNKKLTLRAAGNAVLMAGRVLPHIWLVHISLNKAYIWEHKNSSVLECIRDDILLSCAICIIHSLLVCSPRM